MCKVPLRIISIVWFPISFFKLEVLDLAVRIIHELNYKVYNDTSGPIQVYCKLLG